MQYVTFALLPLLFAAGCGAETSTAIPLSTTAGMSGDAGGRSEGGTPTDPAAMGGGTPGGPLSPGADGTMGPGNPGSSREVALDACEQATGTRGFANCPLDVLCSSLSAADALSLSVPFDPLTQECPWSANGNQAKRNGWDTARVEQIQDLRPQLVVPDGSVPIFCSIDISVTAREAAGLHYDDWMLFVFGGFDAQSGADGGAVLMTRMSVGELSASVPELPNTMWPLYDWPTLSPAVPAADPLCSLLQTCPESPSSHGDALWCLDGGTTSTCSLPETDTAGDFSIQLDPQIAGALGLRAALNGNYNLSVIITGDDDSGSDCQHNGFDATVNVGYVVIPEDEIEQIAIL